MKMKVFFMCMITFVLFNFASFSQQQNLSIESLRKQIESVPYIFKGEIIDIQFYVGDELGNRLPEGNYHLSNGELGIGYSSAKVNICQILKGNEKLKHGTIEIITSDPWGFQPMIVKNEDGRDTIVSWMGGSFCSGCERFPLIKDKFSAIFFCVDSKFKGESGFQFDNSFGVYFSSLGFARINNNWIGFNVNEKEFKEIYNSEINSKNSSKENITYSGLNGNIFYSPDELYEYYKQFDGVNIQATDYCKKTYFLPENKDSLEQIKIQNQIRYEQKLKEYKINMEYIIKNRHIDTAKTPDKLEIELQNNNIQKKSKGIKGVDLTLEIANPKLTGTNSNDAFLEFDVLVSSNSSVYFDDCLMQISYNTTAFGSYLFTNTNVTVTKGTAFNNSTYIFLNASDYSSSEISINFGSDYNLSSFNRTLISSSPQVLLHFKFKIANNGCDNYANINFTNTTSTSDWSSYTTTANAPWSSYIFFNNTYYNGSVSDKTCIPIITNFTQDIPAGNGSILTILGRYFGEAKSTGTVIFKDANQGNIYPVLQGSTTGELIGIDNYDTISWSDNEIKIKLPSVLDKIAVHSNPADNKNPVPGSGLFKVKNFTTKEKETNTSLIIPYALYQGLDYWPVYQKVNVYLANQNDSGGYTIRCNSSMLGTFPNAKSVINRAIKDWNCATLVNWRIGSDTVSTNNNDGVCSIFSSSTSPGLMATYHKILPCTTSTPKKYYLRDFDIEINSSYNWQVDTSGVLQTGKYDFYHAIAHELGHGLLLFHANQQGEIMYYGASPGASPSGTPENQRVLVWNSNGAMDGGFYETQNFASSLPSCTGEHTIYSAPQNCTGFSVQDRDLDKITLKCFPNPIESGNLTLQIDLNKNTYIYYKLYNSIGQIIRTSVPELHNEQIYLNIPTDGLQNGFYYMQVYLNNRYKTVKWIKL